MLRSVCNSGLLRARLCCCTPQRSSSLPVFCKRKKHQGQRGKQQQSPRQRNLKQQNSAGAFFPEPEMTPAQERLKFASASLHDVARLKTSIEQHRPEALNQPVMSALLAKAESAAATIQAALDADADSLTDRDVNAVLSFEVSLYLAAGLAHVMTAPHAWSRTFPASHTFEQLEQQGYNLKGAQDMYLLAPVVARLLCSAVPGFKMFIWLPARLRYAMAAMQAENWLLNEPQLLAQALDNPITGAGRWDNFVRLDEEDIMVGLASGTNIARKLSMQNGSSIYLMTADEAAPSIHREVSGGQGPWAVMPCDPSAKESPLSQFYGVHLMEVMADGEAYVQQKSTAKRPKAGFGSIEDDFPFVTWKAVSRPCGVLVMF